MFKRELTPEDFSMICHWLVFFVLAPFVLLPVFDRQDIDLAVRLGVLVGLAVVTGAMTLLYLLLRRKRSPWAPVVANLVAVLDVLLIAGALVIWPEYMPELFWVFALMVLVTAVRFGYRETAVATLAFAAIYMMTIAIGYGAEVTATVMADALVRVLLMGMIAFAAAYLTQGEMRRREESRILSDISRAISSTLVVQELMEAVVVGASEITGRGRSTAYRVSPDGRWLVPMATTEHDAELRSKILGHRIDIKKENPFSAAMGSEQPVLVDRQGPETLTDEEPLQWTSSTLLAAPIMLRGDITGILTVEPRSPWKRFSDRDRDICKAITAQAASGLENASRYEEETRRRSEADTLYRASRELGSTLDLEQVLENACRLAARNADGTGAVVFLLDEETGTLEPQVMVSFGARRTNFLPDSGVRLDDFEEMYGLAQRPPALMLRKPIDNQALPPFLRSAGSLVIAPFYMHGRLGGLLCVTETGSRRLDEGQAAQVSLVASEVALAVINARLHQRMKNNAAQMSSLVQLANAIGSTSDLSSIFELALGSMKNLFNCSSGLIYRIDDKDETMRCVESFGYPQEILNRICAVPYPRADDCWAVTEDRLICVDDLSRTATPCRTLEKIKDGSVMCICLQAEGRTLGVLHVRSEETRAFREEDQQLAYAFADQVAIAIQRALLFEEINRLAITDPLTGVLNLRRMSSMLEEEIGRARRYKRPVSFLMIDVDNLKAYNDTQGHQRGDVVLSQVASIVDSGTREMDKVFRYGGDEFCVILPETDTDEALVVAEKVRRSVDEFHFAGEETAGQSGITISVGVATFPKDCEGASSLVQKADLALYAAKQTGRNSVASSF